MSKYAVRNDGHGWRAVGGPDDIAADEWYCTALPPDPVPVIPSSKELSVDAKAARDKLLAIAANRMGPLQDAIDTESATEEEVERLLRWKRYRIALNRIEMQEKFPVDVEWPVSPDQFQ